MAIEGLPPITGPEITRNLPTTQPLDAAVSVLQSLLDDSSFVPTSDLNQLLLNARESSQIRQEIIGEVARRLTAGELFTRPAAEQTVEGILESQAATD